ncbi:hypothetical protein RJ640_029006, partial [Escallonia rubra]
ESLCEPYAVRVARTVTRGVRVYTCSVVVGPTHPICSMIYGSTGATHFDQLAKILTGYEITGARSSGIFMGILSIAVGSLFKITAVPFRAAVGLTAAYRCIITQRTLLVCFLLAGKERRATSMGADYPNNPWEQ